MPGPQEVPLFPEPQVSISGPVKALLIAPRGHLCIQRRLEEAATLHVGRDLLQSLRVRKGKENQCGLALGQRG